MSAIRSGGGGRSDALALIIHDIAKWQQGLVQPIKDDASGRALLEAKVAEVQHRLKLEVRIAEDLPRAVVVWEGVGRREPRIVWAPHPLPAYVIEHQRRMLEEAKELAQRGLAEVKERWRQAALDAIAPLKRGKWVASAFIYSGSLGITVQGQETLEKMRAEVERRANEAVDEAIEKLIAYYEKTAT